MTSPRTTGPCAVAAMIAVAMIASGCGSSSKHAGSTRSPYQKELAYARCMRTHGVASFPDPTATANGGGGLIIHGGPGTSLNPSSPSFQSASQACAKLSPKGAGPLGGGIPTSAKKQALAFSRCMRSHGVPSFPDPQFSGNAVRVQIGGGADPSSPAFKAAQKACGSPLPGGTIKSVGGPG